MMTDAILRERARADKNKPVESILQFAIVTFEWYLDWYLELVEFQLIFEWNEEHTGCVIHSIFSIGSQRT